MSGFTSFDLDGEPPHTLGMPATMCFSEGMLPEDCVVMEFTGAGGRIKVEDSGAVPDDFTLLLSSNGGVRRQCKVAWRKAGEIGVNFI